jgi:hypothetical protein
LKRSPERRPTVSVSLWLTPVTGSQVQIPLHPSNCLVTALKLDKDRKSLLERKKRVAKQKNKHKEGMTGVD